MRGTFQAGGHAGPVYRLLGKRDLGTDAFPPLGTLLADGEIAFRQHAGGHTTGPDGSFFLDYAGQYLDP